MHLCVCVCRTYDYDEHRKKQTPHKQQQTNKNRHNNNNNRTNIRVSRGRCTSWYSTPHGHCESPTTDTVPGQHCQMKHGRVACCRVLLHRSINTVPCVLCQGCDNAICLNGKNTSDLAHNVPTLQLVRESHRVKN